MINCAVVKNKSLICVYYAHQLLPAIAAIIHYRKTNNLQIDAPADLLVWSHQSKSILQSGVGFDLINKMIAAYPWITLFSISPSAAEKVFSIHKPVLKRKKILNQFVPENFYSEVVFSHDLTTDFTSQLLMQAFPCAKRICYGDSLGIVYSKKYFEKNFYANKKTNGLVERFNNFLAKVKRWYVLPQQNKIKNADIASLLIPCDPGGDFLLDKLLLVPSKEEALSVIQNLSAGLVEFNNYCQKLISRLPSERYLFVMGNLTESHLTDRKREINLYYEMIEKHLKKGAAIILKPHPGANKATVEQLAVKLQSEYLVHVFEPYFNNIPIELASILVNACQVFSLSYSVISLKYLYQSHITYVLNDELLTRFFYSKKSVWIEDSHRCYQKLIDLLDRWDGYSVLSLNE